MNDRRKFGFGIALLALGGSLTFGLRFFGPYPWEMAPYQRWLFFGLAITGLLLWTLGCCFIAAYEGIHPVWGLLGFLSCIGLALMLWIAHSKRARRHARHHARRKHLPRDRWEPPVDKDAPW